MWSRRLPEKGFFASLILIYLKKKDFYYPHNYRHIGDNFLRPQSRLKKRKTNSFLYQRHAIIKNKIVYQ